MTALIFPEGDQSQSLLQLAPSSKTLQQLIQEPLTTLSQLYTSTSTRREEDKQNEIQLVQYPSNQALPHPKLHVTAETSLSSLRAGTASIMITNSYPNGVDFLNLPVRKPVLHFICDKMSKFSYKKIINKLYNRDILIS